MKIRCYDKYQKMWLIIEPADDEINISSYNSQCGYGNISLNFTCDPKSKEFCEDPVPKRWSDLEKFEILK